ncbi:MAG: hypothetical protein PWQ18_1236 [Clostridia bacterium]|nr:hypothetical protein [Clostridia bacterium]
MDIAGAWGIPLGTVEGPDMALAKQVFRGRTLADMIFDVLDQAKKRGAGKWIVRSKQGKIDIVRPGQNSPVYHFGADDNVAQVEDQQDIEDLVTRVKIVGAEAWVQWCIKTVLTERFAYLIYSPNYGCELEKALQQPSRRAVEAELERTITEALLADPRTEMVKDFSFSWQGDQVKVSFTAVPVIGDPERLEVVLGG